MRWSVAGRPASAWVDRVFARAATFSAAISPMAFLRVGTVGALRGSRFERGHAELGVRVQYGLHRALMGMCRPILSDGPDNPRKNSGIGPQVMQRSSAEDGHGAAARCAKVRDACEADNVSEKTPSASTLARANRAHPGCAGGRWRRLLAREPNGGK